ncbi:MAG: hypothetical protein IT466_10410 [Moraxellaceae bacterium]|nr:hypothetical protein [Moraxellaceae bacterium]
MMYHLKALIAAHRAKLAVAALGYALYGAIDPASSAHAGFAVAAVVLMGLFVFVPAMLLAAHVDRVKPGKVEKPFKLLLRESTAISIANAGLVELVDDDHSVFSSSLGPNVFDRYNPSLVAQNSNPCNVRCSLKNQAASIIL